MPHSIGQSKLEANPESGAGKWTQSAKYVLILLLEFLKFQGLHFSLIKGHNFFKEQTMSTMLFFFLLKLSLNKTDYLLLFKLIK